MSSLALTVTSPRLPVLPTLVYFPIIASTSFSTTATPTEPDTPALFPPPRPMIKRYMSSLESALTVSPPGARITAQSEASVPSPIRALTVFKNTSTCTEPPAPALLVLPAAPPLTITIFVASFAVTFIAPVRV